MVCNYFLFEYLLFINIPIYKHFLFINIPLYKYLLFINIPIYKYSVFNITLKIPLSTFRYVMVFNHIKSRCSISSIHTQSTTGYNSHHISKYMKNNKITVEESSRIPPTCFPTSQMLNNIDNITFSSI